MAVAEGDRVLVSGWGSFRGTVRWLGNAAVFPAPYPWVGIEFDQAVGKNDGSALGERFFTCSLGHGIFARAGMVTRHKDQTPAPAREKPTYTMRPRPETPQHHATDTHTKANNHNSSKAATATHSSPRSQSSHTTPSTSTPLSPAVVRIKRSPQNSLAVYSPMSSYLSLADRQRAAPLPMSLMSTRSRMRGNASATTVATTDSVGTKADSATLAGASSSARGRSHKATRSPLPKKGLPGRKSSRNVSGVSSGRHSSRKETTTNSHKTTTAPSVSSRRASGGTTRPPVRAPPSRPDNKDSGHQRKASLRRTTSGSSAGRLTRKKSTVTGAPGGVDRLVTDIEKQAKRQSRSVPQSDSWSASAVGQPVFDNFVRDLTEFEPDLTGVFKAAPVGKLEAWILSLIRNNCLTVKGCWSRRSRECRFWMLDLGGVGVRLQQRYHS